MTLFGAIIMFGVKSNKKKRGVIAFNEQEKTILKQKLGFNDDEVDNLKKYIVKIEHLKHSDSAIFDKHTPVVNLITDIKRLFLKKGYYFEDRSIDTTSTIDAQTLIHLAKKDTAKSRFDRLEKFIEKEIDDYRKSRSMHTHRTTLLKELEKKINDLKEAKNYDVSVLQKYIKGQGKRAQAHHASESGLRIFGFLFNKESRFKKMADRIQKYSKEINSPPLVLEPSPSENKPK